MTYVPKERPSTVWPIDRPVELADAELDQVVGGTQPPGLLGYEGHPGNQGGPQHHP
jgi:hypothetical protein